MATMGFTFNGGEAGRAITGQIKTTHVKAILAEADLPTIATRATQLSKCYQGYQQMVTTRHPSNPTIHHSYVIPAGTRCFQAKMKAIKKALQIIQTEESPQKV